MRQHNQPAAEMPPPSSGPSSAPTRAFFVNTSVAAPMDSGGSINIGRPMQYPSTSTSSSSENISATAGHVRSGEARGDDSRSHPNLGWNQGVRAFPPARRGSNSARDIQGLDRPPDQQQYRQPSQHETLHELYYRRNNNHYDGPMRPGQQDYVHHGTRSSGFGQLYSPNNNLTEHNINRNDHEGYDEGSRPLVLLSSSRPHSEASSIGPPRRSSYGDPAVRRTRDLYVDISKRWSKGPRNDNTEQYPGQEPPSKVRSPQPGQSLPRRHHRSRSQEPIRTPGIPGHYRQDLHHREHHSGHPYSRPPPKQQAHAHSVQEVSYTGSTDDRQHENQQLLSEQAMKPRYMADAYSRYRHPYRQLSPPPPAMRQSFQRTRASVNYDDSGHWREEQAESRQHQYPMRYTPEQFTGTAPREPSALSGSDRNYAEVDAQHQYYKYGEHAGEGRQQHTKQQHQHKFQESFVTHNKASHDDRSYRSTELGKQQLHHNSSNNTAMDLGHERSSLQQQPRPPPSLQEAKGRRLLSQDRIQQTVHTQAVQQSHEHRPLEAPAWDMSSEGEHVIARSHARSGSTGAVSQPTTSSMRMSGAPLFNSDMERTLSATASDESGSGRANVPNQTLSIQGMRRDRVGSGALTTLGNSGDDKGDVCSQRLQHQGAKCGAGDGEKLDEEELEHDIRGDYIQIGSDGDYIFKKTNGASSGSSTAGSDKIGYDRWLESDSASRAGSSSKRQAPPEGMRSADIHKDMKQRRTSSSLFSTTLCPEVSSPSDSQASLEALSNAHRGSSRRSSLHAQSSLACVTTAPLDNADRATHISRITHEQVHDIGRIGVGTSERRGRHARSLQDSSETPSHETGATQPTTSLIMERIPSPATGGAMLLHPFDSDSAVPTERSSAIPANSIGIRSFGGYDGPPIAPLEPTDFRCASQNSITVENQRTDSVASSDNGQLAGLASAMVATRDGPVSSTVLSSSLNSANHGTGNDYTTFIAVVSTPAESLERNCIVPSSRPISPCAVSKTDKALPIAGPVESCRSDGCEPASGRTESLRLGEEGYYTSEDLSALFVMWEAGVLAAEPSSKNGIEQENESVRRRRTRKGKGRRRTSQSSIEEQQSVFEDDEEEEEDDDNSSEIDGTIDCSEDEDEDDEDCSVKTPSKRPRITEKVKSRLHGREKSRKKDRRSGEVKRHQCQICGKRFSRPSQLETHMLTHTGEKPHVCTTCRKHFNVASNLKRHIRTHETGKRNGIGFSNTYDSNTFLLRVSRESAMGLGLVNGVNGALPQPLPTINAVVQLSPTFQPPGQQDITQQQDLQLQQTDNPQAVLELQQQLQQPQEQQTPIPLQQQFQLQLQRASWEEMASLSSIYSTAIQSQPSTHSSLSPLSGAFSPTVQPSGSTAASAANAPYAPSNTTFSLTAVPAIQRKTSA